MTESGSVAEEASRLFEALAGWASAHAGARDVPAATCRACPVCQLLALVGDARPEVLEHLGDAVGSLVQAARAALDGAAERQRPRPPHVQHIDIG